MESQAEFKNAEKGGKNRDIQKMEPKKMQSSDRNAGILSEKLKLRMYQGLSEMPSTITQSWKHQKRKEKSKRRLVSCKQGEVSW